MRTLYRGDTMMRTNGGSILLLRALLLPCLCAAIGTCPYRNNSHDRCGWVDISRQHCETLMNCCYDADSPLYPCYPPGPEMTPAPTSMPSSVPRRQASQRVVMFIENWLACPTDKQLARSAIYPRSVMWASWACMHACTRMHANMHAPVLDNLLRW